MLGQDTGQWQVGEQQSFVAITLIALSTLSAGGVATKSVGSWAASRRELRLAQRTGIPLQPRSRSPKR